MENEIRALAQKGQIGSASQSMQEQQQTPSQNEKANDNEANAYTYSKDKFKRIGTTAIGLAKLGIKSIERKVEETGPGWSAVSRKVKAASIFRPNDTKTLPSDVITDEELMEMDIGRKNSSEIGREVQKIRHVTVVTPKRKRRVTRTFLVHRGHKENLGSVTVMKLAHPFTAVQRSVFRGPRCDDQGQIVAHSILGDVDSFLQNASTKGHFSDLITAHLQSQTEAVVARTNKTPELHSDRYVNEKRAIDTWEREMELRRKEQRRLAGLLHRPERELLMCTSEGYQRKAELQKIIPPREPADVTFWRLPEVLGTGVIRPCLTDRGGPSSPVVSGPPATMYQQKGLHRLPRWMNQFVNADYLHETQSGRGGIIQIVNQVLFDSLEIIGNAVGSPFHFEAGSMPVTRGNMKSCDLSVPSDQTIFMQESRAPSEHCRIIGPAMDIDGDVYTWKPSNVDGYPGDGDHGNDNHQEYSQRYSNHGDGNQGNNCRGSPILKEVIVLIESLPGEGAMNHVTMENVGTTVLHYHWLKVPDLNPFAIPRPKRRPFYFISEEGVLLPHQKVLVPVLFRSQLPGYFTESWLLDTVPVLENGAKVKFTFKGIVRSNEELTSRSQEIEDYLSQRQIETYINTSVTDLVSRAVLKGTSQEYQLRDDSLAPPSIEEVFKDANPGLHYHHHIVQELLDLHNSLMSDSSNNKQVTMTTGEEIIPERKTLDVAHLRKMILGLPDEDEDEEEKQEVEAGALETNRQDQLLHKLTHQVALLSYRPLFPCQSESSWKHSVVHSMLAMGLDSTVRYSYQLATRYGLYVRGEETRPPSPENKTKKVKKHSMSVKVKPQDRRTSKIQVGKDNSPTNRSRMTSSVSSDDGSDLVPFSPVHKLRKDPGLKATKLTLYDEKVYTEMYTMLSDTFDKFFDLLG